MNRQDAGYVAQTAALLSARATIKQLPQGAHIAARDALDLHRIATRLHRLAERSCNEDLGCRECDASGWSEESRNCKACAGTGLTTGPAEARMEKRAATLAAPYGLRVYFQGDPRGCPLYLIPLESGPQTEDDSRYNQRGSAVCYLG